jgi:hypothetical protein
MNDGESSTEQLIQHLSEIAGLFAAGAFGHRQPALG